jgi:hypothetical protein
MRAGRSGHEIERTLGVDRRAVDRLFEESNRAVGERDVRPPGWKLEADITAAQEKGPSGESASSLLWCGLMPYQVMNSVSLREEVHQLKIRAWGMPMSPWARSPKRSVWLRPSVTCSGVTALC